MAAQSDLRFTFTAGEDGVYDFEVVEFHLVEGLSETFRLDVDLSCANSAVDFGLILDHQALLTLWQANRPVRYLHGSVSSFQQGDTGFRRTRYRATVEPRLARMRLASDWRIFQGPNAPEIAKVLLTKHGLTLDYEQRLTHTYQPREYCVQAGDTDYHFVERIMREEGSFYGFLHSAEGHRLIHCDRLWVFGKQPGPPLEYNPMAGGDSPGPALHSFVYTENVRTACQTQRDYSFKNPMYNQETECKGTDLDHQSNSYERYDYPGRYKGETGTAFTRDRLRGLRSDARIVRAQGDDARLVPGICFDLIGHPRQDMNRGWRPIRIEHHGKQYISLAEESAEAERGTHYSSTAILVPDDTEWRPSPLRKPRIEGPQQATVVGPAGEEIYCDRFGRVKVQFPWDREGNNDEHSSCWIRVSHNIAGALWGHMAIPRIGQEVIVGNFDGDPDQPIITGRNYNANQLPPYELPAHKTRMTIRTQTHKGEGFNEIRFEDEAAQEEIFIHAQKDQNNIVNNDETTMVGHDRSERVENDETLVIGHDRTESIGNDEQLTLGRDRRQDIGQDDHLTIGRNLAVVTTKDRIEEVGNNRHDKTTANQWIQIGGHLEKRVEGHVLLNAGQHIRHLTQDYEILASRSVTLKAPGGTLRIDDRGMTLDGLSIRILGAVALNSEGSSNSIAANGVPTAAEPVCLGCLLKAIAEGRSLVRMEGAPDA